MKLYHGTSTKHLKKILGSGLLPRRKRKGNWGHTSPSRSEAVYLTTAYAIHFAEAAVTSIHDLALVEVDLSKIPEIMIGPDEDFLEQGTRKSPAFQNIGDTAIERAIWFSERSWEEYQHLWSKSLEYLGSVCVLEHIPRTAFTRVARIPKGHPIIRESDPVISISAYQVVGAYYRNLTRYVFGDAPFENDILHKSQDITRVPRDEIEVQTISLS